MTKEELLNLMSNEIELNRQGNYFCYTCCLLEGIIKAKDLSLKLEDYKEWLKSSSYFYRGTHTIYTNIKRRDYEGKLAMFKEFLDQYEGPL